MTARPASVVTADNGVFYLAEDGFYVTDGAGVRNISAERVTDMVLLGVFTG